MKPRRLTVRFRVAEPADDLSPAIDAFHRFIQRGKVEGLVLDVADYRHVPQGPGVVLIGHDVDYGINDVAFQVTRKRSLDDAASTQIRDALRMGLGALDALAYDGGVPVTIEPTRFTVSAFDRGLGSREEVEANLRKAVDEVVGDLYDGTATITAIDGDDPRVAPELLVEAAASDAAEILDRLGGSQAPGQSPWDIPVEELARLRSSDEEFTLVDVREESEYETVNLGGTLIPLATLGDRLDELDRDAHVVVHCRAGHRGATAVGQLRDAGFTNVWNVNGALMAWIDRIDPSLPRY